MKAYTMKWQWLCCLAAAAALFGACDDSTGVSTGAETLVDTGASSGTDANDTSGSTSGSDTSGTGTASGGDATTSGGDTDPPDTSTPPDTTEPTDTPPDTTPLPACDDGLKNGDETDIDCGGSCGPCAAGKACAEQADCAEGECLGNICTCPPSGCGVEDCFFGDVVCDPNATCIPSRISAFCDCNEGFEGDGLTCADVDECAAADESPCGPGTVCLNNDGGYTCACADGFEGDGTTCTNINECEDGSATCDPNATCTDSDGSYTCTCADGYEGDGQTCADIDECPAADCAPNSTCVNLPGSFECACNDGFTPDANGNCVDALDCDAGPAVCDPNATCTAMFTGWYCMCNDGFVGDGAACANTNECEDGSATCDPNATCTDSDGSYTCTCIDGYEGDGQTCTDINECLFARCGLNSTCVNLPGSFECACNDGFTLDPDGSGLCVDINECDDRSACNLNATCTNTEGGFSCACHAGFAGDGQACVESSCLGFVTAARASGIKQIDPDGPGGADPFDVLCDLATDGGGWTSLNHGAGLASVNFSIPYTQVALSSGTQFWILEERPTVAYTTEPYDGFESAMRQANGLTTPAETGWLWNGVPWANPDFCHTTQQIILVPDPTLPPRSNGNPHYNTGFGMDPNVAAAAIIGPDLMGLAPEVTYPSVHIGCVGWNVLTDPIVWVR